MEKKNFNYGDHCFYGIEQFSKDMTFKNISSQIYSPIMDDKEEGKNKWNWNDFYKEAEKSGYGKMDLFRMDEKFTVIPCTHFLAIYGEKSHQLYTTINNFGKEQASLTERKRDLYQDAIEMVIKCLRTKENNTWDLDAAELSLSIPLFCDGYTTAEIKKIYLDNGVLTLVDDAGFSYSEKDNTVITLDCLFDIINMFYYNEILS